MKQSDIKTRQAELNGGSRWVQRLVRWIYFRVCAVHVLKASLAILEKAGECAKEAAKHDQNEPYLAGFLDGKAAAYREWSDQLRKNVYSANAQEDRPA